MALPCSGAITAAMINVELGLSATAPFDINSTVARALAGVPSGPISFSDFYCKSSVPPVSAGGWVTVATDRNSLGAGDQYADGILIFKNDGSVINVGNSIDADNIYHSEGPASWRSPYPVAGAGNGIFIRFSNVIFSYNGTDQSVTSGNSFSRVYSHFGSVPYLGLYASLPFNIGTWGELSSDRAIQCQIENLESDPSWTIATASVRIRGTIEFSSSASGTPILSTGSFNVLTSIGGTGIVQPLINRTWTSYHFSSGTALSWFYLTNDGTITCLRGESPTGDANVHVYDDYWYTGGTPTASYWVRGTLVSGSAPNNPGTDQPLDTWLQISGPGAPYGIVGWTNRSTSPTAATRQMVIKVDIATDAAGTNIVTSGTYNLTSVVDAV